MSNTRYCPDGMVKHVWKDGECIRCRTEMTFEDASDTTRLDSTMESANFWRHVAYELAGQDRAKVSAAEDVVCDKFIAAGRQRVGPKLPERLHCKHGVILYGTRCLTCERDGHEVNARE